MQTDRKNNETCNLRLLVVLSSVDKQLVGSWYVERCGANATTYVLLGLRTCMCPNAYLLSDVLISRLCVFVLRVHLPMKCTVRRSLLQILWLKLLKSNKPSIPIWTRFSLADRINNFGRKFTHPLTQSFAHCTFLSRPLLSRIQSVWTLHHAKGALVYSTIQQVSPTSKGSRIKEVLANLNYKILQVSHDPLFVWWNSWPCPQHRSKKGSHMSRVFNFSHVWDAFQKFENT